MQRRRILLLAGVTIAAGVVLAPAQAKGAKEDRPTILVKFVQPGYDNDSLVQQDGDQAVGAVGELKTKTVIVKLKKGASVADKIAEYEARDDVVYAEANGTASASDDPTYASQAGLTTGGGGGDGGNAASGSFPNDPYFGSQWGVTGIHMLEAWPVFPGSYDALAGPAIAIVDSGVDSLHPDLWGKVATDLGASCLSGVCASDGAADDYGHGTHVAGIAAARANDGVGVAGVAFDAPVIPVKVLDSTGTGTYASIASGIIWAADGGARVINLSLGSTAYSQTVCDAVTYAIGQGAVVVAAAGNNGTSTPFYPAACPGAIGVAATDSTDTRASFSETGYPNVFLSAPGVGIVSDFPGGQYATDSGTSMAAPFVSGVAEQLLGQNPARTPQDVKMMLAGTADKVGTVGYGGDPYATCTCTWNSGYGYGRVNAYRALTEAPPAPAPDFALGAAPPTLTVARGTSGTFTVSSSSTTGFASPISLSVTGLPSGVTASFSSSTIAGAGSSTLTVTASTSAPYGTYPVTIQGTSGLLVRTTPVTLIVPAPDFTLRLSATSGTIVQSEKGTTSVSLNNLFGFRSSVALGVGGAPAGVTTKLSRTSISRTTAATLTIATTSAAVPGSYDLTITGTSGSVVRTAIYTLTVALAVPDFTLMSATTSTGVRYGSAKSISYKLTVTPKYGFKGTVSMSAGGIPPGSAGTWNPPTVTIPGTTAVYAYYYFSIPAGAPVGTYFVTFTGLGSNGAAHTATAKITIS